MDFCPPHQPSIGVPPHSCSNRRRHGFFRSPRCSTFRQEHQTDWRRSGRSISAKVFVQIASCVRRKNKTKIPQNSKMRYIERRQMIHPVFSTYMWPPIFPISCFTEEKSLEKMDEKTAKPQFPEAHYNVFHYCINSSQKEPKSFDGLEITKLFNFFL